MAKAEGSGTTRPPKPKLPPSSKAASAGVDTSSQPVWPHVTNWKVAGSIRPVPPLGRRKRNDIVFPSCRLAHANASPPPLTFQWKSALAVRESLGPGVIVTVDAMLL